MFSSLNKEALFRTAVEDFGVDVKKTDSKETIVAALLEEGVTWEMYLEAHPEARPVEETPVAVAEVIATAPTPLEEGETTTVVEAAAPVVRTRTEPVNTASRDLYLIKMERDNPYFEYKGYKFTSKHPYVVMPARDADTILRNEEGFTIASPSEAAAYYG